MSWSPQEGGCPCGTIRYRVEQAPLVVHCCHCTYCQKETGSAFALNAMIEAKYVTLLSEEAPHLIRSSTHSGGGQHMARCPKCQFIVWSNYGDSGHFLRFIRVGTLDDPSVAPPDVQIYTSTKQPWVVLNDKIPFREESYDKTEIWSKASLERRDEYMKSLKG